MNSLLTFPTSTGTSFNQKAMLVKSFLYLTAYKLFLDVCWSFWTVWRIAVPQMDSAQEWMSSSRPMGYSIPLGIRAMNGCRKRLDKRLLLGSRLPWAVDRPDGLWRLYLPHFCIPPRHELVSWLFEIGGDDSDWRRRNVIGGNRRWSENCKTVSYAT